ncbi:MAG: hypothetical protein DRR08_04445 [Candidatus Parabeggiatoa sp. nov. 2]|nr:MAG: hypothetical protein B6247_28070 [Beggiatoa sp. 4572_84]RKZ63090.1 MAG: hypothetical protein DRR08_04445 [Gammaproteobacteria bacterium]HEC84073.1 hypothetical protein [Thioploca sp.]
MNVRKYQPTVLATALLLGFATSAPAQDFNVTVTTTTEVLLTPTATTSQCNRDIRSTLRFFVNDRIVIEDLVLDATSENLFNLGDQLNIELVEDLRVCTRYDDVDLWIAVEMPDDTRLFMVSTAFPPFVSFVPYAKPFKTNLDRGENRQTILNFEVAPGIPTGDYRFYAAYAESGKDLSELLFTLRSNRAMAKVVVSGR